MIEDFHPAVREWFARQFPNGPTPPQEEAWQRIAAGHNTLLAAPTGSGKTLASLLIAIDQLYKQYAGPSQNNHDPNPKNPEQVQVVYVSPLKALATDISENLERPLAEIAECARELNLQPPTCRSLCAQVILPKPSAWPCCATPDLCHYHA